MSFKDRDETPEERKKRERNENPSQWDPIRVTYCKACGCHYTGGCGEHDLTVQVSLATPVKK